MVSDRNCLKYFYCNHQVHRDFLITLYKCNIIAVASHSMQTDVLGILSGTYLCLLQLFLSPAFSEVRTLIEVKEEHEEDD
jgi:hypothetical protein